MRVQSRPDELRSEKLFLKNIEKCRCRDTPFRSITVILSPEIGIILTKTPFAEAENPGNRDIKWDLPMFDLVNIFDFSRVFLR